MNDNPLYYFVNREDAWGQYDNKGETFTAKAEKKKITVYEALDKHLAGKITIGLHTTNPDTNLCKWGALDIDIQNPTPEDLKRMLNWATVMHDILLTEHGVRAWIDFSGGKGYHVMFKCESIEAVWVFNLLNEVRRKAEERLGVKIGGENYPKQPIIPSDGYGNWIKMPLGKHHKTGKLCVLVDHKTKEFMSLEDSIKALSEAPVNKIPHIGNPVVSREYGTGKIARSEAKIPLKWSCLKNMVKKGASEGERHYSMMILSHYAYANGWSKEEARNLLHEFNGNSDPQKPAEEIDREIDYQWKRCEAGHCYVVGCRGDGLISQTLNSFCSFEDKTECIQRVKDGVVEIDLPGNMVLRGTPRGENKYEVMLLNGSDVLVLDEMNPKTINARKKFVKEAPDVPGLENGLIELAQMSRDKKYVSEVTPTTITNVTTTTTVTKLHPGGGIIGKTSYEPIGDNRYVYCTGNKKGVSVAWFDKETDQFFITFENEQGERKQLSFNGKPIEKPFFRIPSMEIIQEWLDGKYTIKDLKTIFNDLVAIYSTNFECTKDTPYLAALHTLISWLREVLKSFFYLGVDATRGAGKSSLLYALTQLSKHGSMGGDISTSFLARAVDKMKLALFIDEIDQQSKDRKSELEAILRKGQRRGTTFNRINPNTMEPESFEVHGAHCFSYRTEVEDALKSRTLPIRLKVSSNKTLPILNYYIDQLTEATFNDLFFWFLENAPRLSYGSYEVTLVTLDREALRKKNVSDRREYLFKLFTKGFKQEQIALMDELVGRNIELLFVCLQACYLLDLDVFSTIKTTLTNKQKEEAIPESFYLERLKDFFEDVYVRNVKEWTLKKGEHEGCFRYPKNKAFAEFVSGLKKADIPSIGTSYFNGLLKDMGFIEGVNWKNQKDLADKPVRCLIFDSSIQKVLTLKEPVDEKTKNEQIRDAILEQTSEEISDSALIPNVMNMAPEGQEWGRSEIEKVFSHLVQVGVIHEPKPGRFQKV